MNAPLRLSLLRPVLLACAALAALSPSRAAEGLARTPDGLLLPQGDKTLKIQVLAPNIVRVACAPDPAFFERRSLAVLPNTGPTPAWTLATDANEAVVSTSDLQVHVDRRTGAVRFLDAAGAPILAEAPGGRTLERAVVQGEPVLQVRQRWLPNEGEALYGLGQHQFGLMNIAGRDLDLWQRNTEIAVPFLVSSRGYGILWDQDSRTRFGDLRDPEPIPAAALADAEGRPGALTATYYADRDFGRAVATRREDHIDFAVPLDVPDQNARLNPALPPKTPVSVRWTGSLVVPATGDYTLWPFYNGQVRLWVDGSLVVDHWRQGWLPWYDQARVRLEAGRPHAVRIDWVVDQTEATMKLLWKTPSAEMGTALWSEAADGEDYVFIHGPSLDRVIAGYRTLTGRAAMLPEWAFGLWQSRERYRTQQESLDVLAEYRRLHAPVDVIVQDWFYWRAPEWGSHEFDPERFPDPAGWIKAIHEHYHARLLISVWPKFHEGTRNFEELNSRGFLYQANLVDGIADWTKHRFTFYDAFNPEARKLFWSQMNRELFRKGVDAWWLDASEPELRHAPMLEDTRHAMGRTAAGSASRVMLAYPLVNAEAVYEGQRAAAPDQRVCILTRSGFAGLQRYGAASWSGDITSTWTSLRKQIPAGLSFGLSGLPYWTTDSGGFAVPPRWAAHDDKAEPPFMPTMGAADAEEWAELNTRWLEYATFCPLMRIHGQFPYREIWQFGGTESESYRAQLKCDRLRYRLLPYVYTLAGDASLEGGTMMRALVMDFRDDPAVHDIGDEFMFGPAFLVAPVTEYKARSRQVYLPATAGGWYDLWTGKAQAGGRRVEAAAPYDEIPVHVRAGSIVPTGPERQFALEKPSDPVTLYVYAGADGAFSLYEDDGLSYACERGQFSRIPLRWDEAARTLTIGARQGSFPGMLAERRFRVVWVTPSSPVGFSFDPAPDREVPYSGRQVVVKMGE